LRDAQTLAFRVKVFDYRAALFAADYINPAVKVTTLQPL